MCELNFRSKWFERCVRNYLGIETRAITDEDVGEIKYLFVATTHSYELGFAKILPPELFQTCACPDAGDEWYCACIENTGKYRTAQDIVELRRESLEAGCSIYTLRLREELPRFEYSLTPAGYYANRKVMEKFDKSVTRCYAKSSDFDGLEKDEVTCDYGMLAPEDFALLPNLEVLRLMSCEREIHSLKFLESLPQLRVLELGELFLNDLEGLDKLIGLEKLCIWSN